jgi:hypothetical protein
MAVCSWCDGEMDTALFTVEEASRRLSEPDMVGRRGAELLRRALPPSGA